MTKEIPLTHGKIALVDDADYEWLRQWRWSAWSHKRNWYAIRYQGKPRKNIFMHVEIIKPSECMVIDHRDRNGLNNQRYNLRECTNVQNFRNRRRQINNTSGYIGVDKNRGRWRARVDFYGKKIHVYYGYDLEAAARAYDAKAFELFGEFASLNFPNRLDSGYLKKSARSDQRAPGQ